MIEDTTRLVQTEQALRHSEERYRTLVQNIPDVVWSIDEQLSLHLRQPACRAGAGLFQRGDLIGTPLETVGASASIPTITAWVAGT